MNVEIYADETGSHDKTGKEKGARVMGIAGYLAFPADWAKLSDEWQKVLDEFNADYFHFSELVDKRKRQTKPDWPYYGWTDEHAGKFLDKLAAISGAVPLFGFAALVSVKDYEKTPPQFHKDLYRHPYFLCLHLFLNMVLDWMEKQFVIRGTKPSLYLDNSPEFQAHALTVWKWVKSEFDIENRMASKPDFKDAMKCLPMQCADLLAYRMRQALDNHLYRDKKGGMKFAISKLDEDLGAKGKLLVQSYSGKHLKALVQRHIDEIRHDRLASQQKITSQ